MSDQTQSQTPYRLYTNDMVVEKARQESTGKNRLPALRNRIARGQARRLVLIAAVAHERGDRTIENEARERLVEIGALAKGQKLSDLYTVVKSRRESRSRMAQSVGVAQAPAESAAA